MKAAEMETRRMPSTGLLILAMLLGTLSGSADAGPCICIAADGGAAPSGEGLSDFEGEASATGRKVGPTPQPRKMPDRPPIICPAMTDCSTLVQMMLGKHKLLFVKRMNEFGQCYTPAYCKLCRSCHAVVCKQSLKLFEIHPPPPLPPLAPGFHAPPSPNAGVLLY